MNADEKTRHQSRDTKELRYVRKNGNVKAVCLQFRGEEEQEMMVKQKFNTLMMMNT